VAPSDATRAVDPNPDQHVATESLSESDTFIDIRGCGPRRDPDGSSWQAAEDLVDQGDALLDLSKADPDARIDVTRVEDRYVKFEFVIWRIGERFTRIERTAGGAADIAAGPVLTGKSGLTRWLVSGRYLSFWTSSSRLPMTFTGGSAVRRLRERDRLDDLVAIGSASKAATEKWGVDLHLFRRCAPTAAPINCIVVGNFST
jgi:hypothetical protein